MRLICALLVSACLIGCNCEKPIPVVDSKAVGDGVQQVVLTANSK